MFSLQEEHVYQYSLLLMKPNQEKITFIVADSLTFTRKFNDYDELSFSVPKYIYSLYTRSNQMNPAWEYIKQGMIIRLTITDYSKNDKQEILKELFIVQQPSLSASQENNSKSFDCIPAHQFWFNKKKVRGLKDTRQLITFKRDGDNNPEYYKGELVQSFYNIVANNLIDASSEGYKEIHTYNPSLITQGGALNYILEYVLNSGIDLGVTNSLEKLSYPDITNRNQIWKVVHIDKEVYYKEQFNNISQESSRLLFEGRNNEANYEEDKSKTKYNKKVLKNGLIPAWELDGATIFKELDEIAPFNGDYIDGTAYNVTVVKDIYEDWREEVDRRLCYVLTGKTRVLADAQYKTYEDIVKEPFLGSFFLSDMEQLLIETHSMVDEVSNFKYSLEGQALLSGEDGFYTKIREFCDYLLYQVITPLYVYKTATSANVYRNVDFSSNTVTEVFKSLEEIYSCIFVFDNVNKDIYIYDRKNEIINQDVPLILSGNNFITDINYQATTDQVVTRLYPTGKDGLTIGGYSITGLNYVDDFTYFFTGKDINLYASNDKLYEKIMLYQNYIEDIYTYQNWYDNIDSLKVSEEELFNSLLLKDVYLNTFDGNEENALKFLRARALIYVFQYIPNDGGTTDFEFDFFPVTISWIQDKIVQLENDLAVIRPLAKSYLETENNMTETNASSVAITQAARDAATSELERIQAEIENYLYTGYKTDNYSGFYDKNNQKYVKAIEIDPRVFTYTTQEEEGEKYDKRRRDELLKTYYAYNHCYIADNIALLQYFLIEWQKQFQYPNVKDFTLLNNDNIVKWESASIDNYDYVDDSEIPLIFNYDEVLGVDYLQELSNYIYEEDMSFNDISNANVLYLYAKEYIKYINTIPITVNLDLIDILSNSQFNWNWSNLTKVGANIRVKYDDFDLHYDKLKLMSYTHSVANGKTSLSEVVSNTYELQNLYNQVVTDIWVYSYQQIQDILSYQETWEDYLAKQDALLLQGETINSDVTSIVNKANQTVIDSTGLKVSKATDNSISLNTDGYYVHKTTYNTTKTTYTKVASAGSSGSSVDNKNTDALNYVEPDEIVFEDAEITYDTSGNKTKMIVKNIGGTDGDTIKGGFPYLHTGQYFSTEYQARISNDKHYIEVINGEVRWHLITTGDVSSYEQFTLTDFNEASKVLPVYWTDEEHILMTFEETDYPVMVPNKLSDIIISRSKIVGNDINASPYMVVENNNFPYYIYTDPKHLKGFAIKSDGNYQIRATKADSEKAEEIKIPYMFFVNQYPEQDEWEKNYQVGDLVFVSSLPLDFG